MDCLKWSVLRIDEADYGCEERLPGEPQKVLVTIVSDNNEKRSFECSEEWLLENNINEGDEWIDDCRG